MGGSATRVHLCRLLASPTTPPASWAQAWCPPGTSSVALAGVLPSGCGVCRGRGGGRDQGVSPVSSWKMDDRAPRPALAEGGVLTPAPEVLRWAGGAWPHGPEHAGGLLELRVCGHVMSQGVSTSGAGVPWPRKEVTSEDVHHPEVPGLSFLPRLLPVLGPGGPAPPWHRLRKTQTAWPPAAPSSAAAGAVGPRVEVISAELLESWDFRSGDNTATGLPVTSGGGLLK